MLRSLLRNWKGNCRHGSATALQSIKELPITVVGNSWCNQAAGFRVNLIIIKENRLKQYIASLLQNRTMKKKDLILVTRKYVQTIKLKIIIFL